MQSIYLNASQVPAALRGSYTGGHFKARICDTVTVPITAGLWDSGSRDMYYGLEMATGRTVGLSDTFHAPWSQERTEGSYALRAGFCIVNHSHFCGNDMGLTFYLLPGDAAPLLPAPTAELSTTAKLVLGYTAGRKASYAGKDRYEMAKDDHRQGYGFFRGDKPDAFPSREQWEATKVDLVAAGLLNARGAITPAGRNQAPRI